MVKIHSVVQDRLNVKTLHLKCWYKAKRFTTLWIRDFTNVSSCQVYTVSRRGIKQLGISFGSIFLLFYYESSLGTTFIVAWGNSNPWLLTTVLLTLTKPQLSNRGSHAVTAKKYSKKGDARSKLLFWLVAASS